MGTFSRLSKHQRKQILLQSLMYISITVGLVVCFVYVLLPLTLKTLEKVSTSKQSKVVTADDSAPIQTPVLNELPEATNSGNLIISGESDAKSTLVLSINGNRIQETSANDTGVFSFATVQLNKGLNELSVVSQNKSAKTSSPATHSVVFDSEPPKLTIDAPANETTITKRRDQVITIRGTTDPTAKVYINDKVVIVGTEGSFSSLYQLKDGENILQIKARSEAGNETVQELKVTYQP